MLIVISIKYHKENNYWDMSLLKDIFTDSRFTEEESDGCIYIVAGEYEKARNVNKEIKKYKWVVLMITSDEQSKFDVENVKHKNIKIYVQYPKQGRHDNFEKLPIGYSSGTRESLKFHDKYLDYYFSGQVTHERREECLGQLKHIQNNKEKYNLVGLVNETLGFTLGFKKNEYIESMCKAKVAPSPSGHICADSFRFYEALECGAIPIADNISPKGDKDYFSYLFNNVKFPAINDYKDLPGYIEDQVKEYPKSNNRVQAWWIQYKRDLKEKIIEDVSELSGKKCGNAITVIVPTSPIRSNPSIEILNKCIKSIRHHLKNAEIIITFDGVRKEQEDMRDNYEEFIRRSLYRCNTDWNATPIIFDKHTHQVGMAKYVIEVVDTPLILYVEGDTGLVEDRDIDFKYLAKKILSGDSNLIRLHFEGKIPKDHEHLMLGQDNDLIETVQWSQRPHIASIAYYKRILETHFSSRAKCFIEDKMHGVIQKSSEEYGRNGWLQHRLHIYSPEENIKYSVDFNGRKNAPKYDNKQVF